MGLFQGIGGGCEIHRSTSGACDRAFDGERSGEAWRGICGGRVSRSGRNDEGGSDRGTGCGGRRGEGQRGGGDLKLNCRDSSARRNGCRER